MKKFLNLLMIIVLIFSSFIFFTGCEEETEPYYEIQVTDPSGKYTYKPGTRYEYEYDGESYLWDAYLVYYADGDISKEGEIISSRTNQGKTIECERNFLIRCGVSSTDMNGNVTPNSTPPCNKGEYLLKYSCSYNNDLLIKIDYVQFTIFIV